MSKIFKSVQMIDVGDFDGLVEETYGRPYNFQQQCGCQDRGTRNIDVDPKYIDERPVSDKVPDNDYEGVSLASWLAMDPNGLKSHTWQRKFFPNIEMLAADMCRKGLLPAGSYIIKIDW